MKLDSEQQRDSFSAIIQSVSWDNTLETVQQKTATMQTLLNAVLNAEIEEPIPKPKESDGQ